jgi:hypothetical protein
MAARPSNDLQGPRPHTLKLIFSGTLKAVNRVRRKSTKAFRRAVEAPESGGSGNILPNRSPALIPCGNFVGAVVWIWNEI